MDKYGEIENLNVCDNLADHMVGSVYVKFRDENAAARAMTVCHICLFSHYVSKVLSPTSCCSPHSETLMHHRHRAS